MKSPCKDDSSCKSCLSLKTNLRVPSCMDQHISTNGPSGNYIRLYISIPSLKGLVPKHTLKTKTLIPRIASEEGIKESHYFSNLCAPGNLSDSFPFPLNSGY